MSDFRVDASTAIVSEIAVNHAGSLYCGGTRTVAALCDLAEIVQAIVLYDQVLLTPRSLANADFLHEVNGVLSWTVSEDKVVDEIQRHQQDGNRDATILLGPVLLSRLLAKDPVLWALFDPSQLSGTEDRGAYYFNKLSVFMWSTLAQRGLVEIDPEALELLSGALKDTLEFYTHRAKNCNELSAAFGGTFISSSLEQPLLDLVRIDELVESEDVGVVRRQLQNAIDLSLINTRKLCLHAWRMPAIGLHVLGQADTLDEVPRLMNEARERFAKLREGVNALEREYRQLIDDGVDGSIEYALLIELPKREREMQAAYEAFAASIDDGRASGAFERTESALSLLGFLRGLAPEAVSVATGSIAGGVVGAIEKAWGALGLDSRLRRRALLSRVRGLCGAASFFNQPTARAIKGVDAVVYRHLGGNRLVVDRQRLMMQLAFEHCMKIARGDLDEPMVFSLVDPDGGQTELAAGEYWTLLIRNDDLRQMFLKADESG